MNTTPVFCAGKSAAADYAAQRLKNLGFLIVPETPDVPCFLLLDVPSFSPEGMLRSGEDPNFLFSKLHPGSIVFGGNLNHPAVAQFQCVDLLKEEAYLEENAKITAYCCLMLSAQALPITLDQAPALVIGWGRIGKVLVRLLSAMGTPVTVAARNPLHLQILKNLGYPASRLEDIPLKDFRLIVNTVPRLVLDEKALSVCPDAIKIDLATVRGLAGDNVIHARGLPGIHAPESSGKLIAEMIIRYLKEMTI